MAANPPLTVNDDSVYIEIFYLMPDVSHDQYQLAQKINNEALCGEIDSSNWSLYTLICEGVFSLDKLPGECSIGVLLSHIYSKLQLQVDEDLHFSSDGCVNPRKADIGDIIAINGHAYFIDVASTFTYIGEVEDLNSSPSQPPNDSLRPE